MSLGETGWKALGAHPADPQYPNQLFAASIRSKGLAFLCLQCEALCRLLCARTARNWSPFSPSQSLLNREESSQGVRVRIFPPRAQIPSSCQEHDVKALPNRWFPCCDGISSPPFWPDCVFATEKGGKAGAASQQPVTDGARSSTNKEEFDFWSLGSPVSLICPAQGALLASAASLLGLGSALSPQSCFLQDQSQPWALQTNPPRPLCLWWQPEFKSVVKRGRSVGKQKFS